MIPKKIHYCWFGGNEKPKKVKECIKSWYKFCPDYEIIEWNEDNFDIHCMSFVEQAYEAKKYAFVSDVARLIVVYEQGGIYMDTDVEVIKPLDDLLDNETFFGFENNTSVSSGLAFGSVAKADILRKHIAQYENISFINEDGSYNMKACPSYLAELMAKEGLELNGKEQIINGVHIYPAEYFNPYNNIIDKLVITDNTYLIHWYTNSWQKNRGPFMQFLVTRYHRVMRKIKDNN